MLNLAAPAEYNAWHDYIRLSRTNEMFLPPLDMISSFMNSWMEGASSLSTTRNYVFYLVCSMITLREVAVHGNMPRTCMADTTSFWIA